jgi:membrane-bound lytic murein transglycosylase MltF
MRVTVKTAFLGCCVSVMVVCSAVAQQAAPVAQKPAPASETRSLEFSNKPWKGDFDAMVERRLIRVLVPYSRTLYYNDRGAEKGITAETVRGFETFINKKHRKDQRPITVMIIPTTRDQLLPMVANGLGDIAAGNLTVTDARLRTVDFVYYEKQKPMAEVIVTGPKAPPLKTLDDLSGKTLHVRPATSYYESVMALNARFKAAGKPPIRIAPLANALEDEDKLEMLNAGLLDIVVVDDWRANMWAQVLPHIKVREDLKLREGAKVGWAIRKGSPKLQAACHDYLINHLVNLGVANYLRQQYTKRVKQIQDPTQSSEWDRFEGTLKLFSKYGDKYQFDPLMLAAQGYQESRLDQGAKSHVGAVGVMQLMPATGKELAVGDISQLEPNIHAGAKYMDQLMTRYFKDAKFDDQNRSLFAFAAYNAGPGRIAQMRKEAAKRGLNPDVWFNNAEIVTAEKVGIETTTYVRNIFKYYVAYTMTLEAHRQKAKALEQTKAST